MHKYEAQKGNPMSSAMDQNTSSIAFTSSGTPMWDPSKTPAHTPAWEPSSRTPMMQPNLEDPLSLPSSNAMSSVTPAQHVPTDHVLLDPRLHNIKVKAVVNGPRCDNKTMFVHGGMWDNHLKIRGKFGKKVFDVEPEWIRVVPPDVTRHDGLLVIIKGSHLGRFARRIHYGYADAEMSTKTAFVALLNRTQGQADSVDEEVHLTADYLAIVDETKEDKDLHSACVMARRKETRASGS